MTHDVPLQEIHILVTFQTWNQQFVPAVSMKQVKTPPNFSIFFWPGIWVLNFILDVLILVWKAF